MENEEKIFEEEKPFEPSGSESELKDLLSAIAAMVKEGHMYINLNMGDTFYRAADEEEIDNGPELIEVAKAYKQYGWEGLADWTAKKRKMVPMYEVTQMIEKKMGR